MVPALRESDYSRNAFQTLKFHRDYGKTIYYFGRSKKFWTLKYPFVWYNALYLADVLTRFDFLRDDLLVQELIDWIEHSQDEQGRFRPTSMYMEYKGWDFADKASRTEYAAGVDLASDLVDRECREDGRPVIVFGGSIGGMLAYHVGCRNENVRGIIATCLVDTRTAEERDALARNRLWSRVGYVTTTLFPFVTRIINIRVHTISKLMAMTNDPGFSRLFVDDPLIGRARMNLGFYKSMTAYAPAVEPELFTRCPLLLVHPARDRWTPFELSESFFDRVAGEKTCVLLERAAHYPYQKPGLDQMTEAVENFVKDIVS